MHRLQTEGKIQDSHFELYVRSGSQAEVGNHGSDVRYALESGSRETPVALPFCAINGSQTLAV